MKKKKICVVTGSRAEYGLLFQTLKKIKKSNHLTRLVTLSPMTDMARRFHTKNGAKELRVNKDTVNYEYDIGN